MKVKHLLVAALALGIIGVVTFFVYQKPVDTVSTSKWDPRFLYIIQGVTEEQELHEPTFAIADKAGNVYVSDSGNGKIKIFGPKGNYLLSFAGVGNKDKLSYPYGIVLLDNGNILVSDVTKGVIFEFTVTGDFIREWMNTRGKLIPGFMAKGPDNKVYVSDLAGKQVVVFDQKGQIVKRLKPRNVSLDSPQGVVPVDENTVIVGDNANCNIKTLGSGGQLKYLFDGGPRVALTTVKGVAVDGAGRIYVAETLANVVRVFNREGEELTGIGKRGSSPGEFLFPTGISIDDKGRLYVVDQANNRVQVWKTR